MVITNESMREYVLANPKLVKKKDLGDGLYLLKYTNKVFYDDLWDEHNKECRGTIVDGDFNLVQYPFTKIFNYGIEKQAPVLSGNVRVTAFKKFNGFMVAITSHEGEILVSTTGNVCSPFVDLAKEYITSLLEEHIKKYPEYTYMFECVHKEDPHIIPEEEGLYYLGRRKKEWNCKIEPPEIRSDVYVDDCDERIFFWTEDGESEVNYHDNPTYLGMYYTEVHTTTLDKLKSIVKNCKHEGFVFYTEDGICSKFKSPYYLVKKLFARGNTDKLLERDIKRAIDEEYYPLVDHIRENKEEFKNLDEQSRLAWIRTFLEATCVLG